MPTIAVNGQSAPNIAGGWGANRPLWSYANLPVARTAQNGLRPIIITGVHLFVGGNGAARQIYYFVSDGYGGQPRTVDFIANSGGAVQRGVGISAGFSDAGGQDFQIGIGGGSGALNIGRAGAGHRTIYGTSFGGMTLAGVYTYAEVPSAPTMVSAVPGPAGTVTVSFTGNGVSDGDSGITGWVLQWAHNAQFNAGVGEVASNGTTSLNLEPGRQYWFRASGRNGVSDNFGTRGQWSGAISATMRSGGKIMRNGAFKDAFPKIRVNGQWRDAKVQVRSGGSWKPAK